MIPGRTPNRDPFLLCSLLRPSALENTTEDTGGRGWDTPNSRTCVKDPVSLWDPPWDVWALVSKSGSAAGHLPLLYSLLSRFVCR